MDATVEVQACQIRVAIIGTNSFIAIIYKIFKIIAILTVIDDNFGKARITYNC